MTDTAVPHRLTQDLVVNTHREGTTVVVVVRGELDVATAPLLRAVLDGVYAARPGRVEVDLSDTAFLDPRALTTLIAARRRLAANRTALVIRQPSRPARRVLALAGLDRAFDYAAPAEPAPAPRRPVAAMTPAAAP